MTTAETKPKSAIAIRKEEVGLLTNELAKMLPATIPADKFVRTVQTAITLNPDLAEADKQSLLGSCMKAASDGLIPDGREGAIVVYKAKQQDGTYKKVAQWLPMVSGLIKRARNTGEIAMINAFVVYKNDKFSVKLGLEMKLEHEPNFEDPGAAIGAYAVVKYKDETVDFEFMSRKQIEAIRERSKAKDFGPWKTDEAEMWRKTVLRRLSKRLPMSSDLRNVIQRVDELYDFSKDNPEPTNTIDGDTGEIIEAPKPRKKRGAAAEKLAPDLTPMQDVTPTAGAEDQTPKEEGEEDNLNAIPNWLREQQA